MEDNVTFATGPAQVNGAVKAWKVPITQALDSEIEGGREGSNQQQERKKTNTYKIKITIKKNTWRHQLPGGLEKSSVILQNFLSTPRSVSL